MEFMKLHEPWLVAAWPGMGAVGLGAVTHLAKQLEARPIGEVASSAFFDPSHLDVKDGVMLPARRPRSWLLGWKAPPGRGRDLVLFLGEAQPAGRAWDLAQAVAEAARQLGVVRVVTFAAMAAPILPTAAARVFSAASQRAVADEAGRCDIQALGEGEIGGLNGLLVGAAAERGIPGLCLLGEFPYFAQAFPNPKASAAILRAFGRLSGVEVDLGPLDASALEVEEQLREIHDHAREAAGLLRVGEPGAGSEDDEGAVAAAAAAEEREARERRERIEALFEAARRDRSKALELKAELDRLGLFREHEDRFLDLFKTGA